ncbi:hypothetical protein B0H12DRAFT_974031, partial [Mycena haematopus]
KPRTFSAVVEFVPLTFDPALENALHEVEDANGLGRGAIVQARYIKPIARRHAGQTVAHMIFSFRTAEGANHAI